MSKASVARRSRPKKKPAAARRAVMDDLVTITIGLERLADDLHMIHHAQGGMVRSAATLKVDHDNLEDFFAPLDEWIGRAFSDASDLTKRALDAGRVLWATSEKPFIPKASA